MSTLDLPNLQVPFISGIEVFEPGHCTTPHVHPHAHELFFILAGEGTGFCGSERFPGERVLACWPGLAQGWHSHAGPGGLAWAAAHELRSGAARSSLRVSQRGPPLLLPRCIQHRSLTYAQPACSPQPQPTPSALQRAVRAGDVVVFRPGALHGIDNGPDSRMYCLELMVPNEVSRGERWGTVGTGVGRRN